MAVTAPEGVYFDPWDPEVSTDPFPYYRQLRDRAPAYLLPNRGFWVLSRHADVKAALHNWEVFSSDVGGTGGALAGMSADGQQGRQLKMMIGSDPPYHTRVRRIVQRDFTPKNILRWEGRIRQFTNDLFDGLVANNEDGSADLMNDLATPLPVMAIAEMLGVPTSDHVDLKRWTEEFIGSASLDSELQENSATGANQMFDYFDAIVREKSKRPGDDLVSQFIKAGERGDDALTHDEIVSHCMLFLIGGNETTTNLIGNTMWTFLHWRDEYRKVQDDLTLVPAAIEESLRYEGPVLGLFRQVRQDVEVADTTIPAGSLVQLLYACANRDERQFPDPDVFRVERNPRDHLAFAGGLHLCIGAPLARLEAKVALETLVSRARNVELNGEPVLNRHILVRGRYTLPITFEVA